MLCATLLLGLGADKPATSPSLHHMILCSRDFACFLAENLCALAIRLRVMPRNSFNRNRICTFAVPLPVCQIADKPAILTLRYHSLPCMDPCVTVSIPSFLVSDFNKLAVPVCPPGLLLTVLPALVASRSAVGDDQCMTPITQIHFARRSHLASSWAWLLTVARWP